MATYLVTGGCGFIGSHLCDALIADGHEIRVLDDLSTGRRKNLHEDVELTIGDIRDRDLVSQLLAGVDGCFHLAAVASVEKSISDWPGTHAVNLTGSINIFDGARGDKPIPVVYASTAAVYGDNASVPISENEMPRPLSAYGADKLGCELHARVANLIHQVPTVGFRFFNVYGPRQDPCSPYSGVISIFVENILNGSPITVFGDGEQIRDFVYVGDVVRFLCKGMRFAAGGSGIFNVCTGRGTSVNQLVQIISAITGQYPTVEQRSSRLGDIRLSVGDPLKARRVLQATVETELGIGLRPTIDAIAKSKTQKRATGFRRSDPKDLRDPVVQTN